jgi:hypothetical protein
VPFETQEDLESFFEIGDGTEAHVTDGQKFGRTFPVIFDEGSEAVSVYDDTSVEAGDASLECLTSNLAGVKRGMKVTFPNAEKHEGCSGKTYEVARWKVEGAGTSRVHLKEL